MLKPRFNKKRVFFRNTILIISVIMTLCVLTSCGEISSSATIDCAKVSSIHLNYWGDGFEKTTTDKGEIENIIKAINAIKLIEYPNHEDIDEKSGAMAITLYDGNGSEIDYLFINSYWIYRGSDPYGKKEEVGNYYKHDDQGITKLYRVIDEICGNPFNR